MLHSIFQRKQWFVKAIIAFDIDGDAIKIILWGTGAN
jgi:hypothetical protein